MYFPDRVTVLRAPVLVGAYGSEGADWAVPVRCDYAASVQPLSSAEQLVNEQRTVTKWRVYLPAHADLKATDRVEWDGLTLEVDGEVETWKGRTSAVHHLEAVLVRVSGG